MGKFNLSCKKKSLKLVNIFNKKTKIPKLLKLEGIKIQAFK